MLNPILNSNSHSKSNWLERLHSSKGFNLDQFLSTQNPTVPKNPYPKPPKNPNPNTPFNLITNVLSDLLVIGPTTNPTNPKKASRKQESPKIFDSGNREVSPLSVNDGDVGVKTKKVVKVKVKKGLKELEKLGFTRTEVTVIDTSMFPEWKGGRVLYRKGLVWKVREKKVVRVGRKRKRKRFGNAIGNAALGNKVSNQNNKREESKEATDQILIPRKPKFSRSPRIPASKNSPILRLKIISKESGTTEYRNVINEI